MGLLLSVASMLLSLLAIFISAQTWRRDHFAERHQMADSQLHEIHKMEYDHPEYRNDEWCKQALNHEDEKIRVQYDVFATMVWNFLETLYDRYGEKELPTCSFYGAMRDLSKRHSAWFFPNNREFFGPQFGEFMQRIIDGEVVRQRLSTGVTVCGVAMLCYSIWILLGKLIFPIVYSLLCNIFPRNYGIPAAILMTTLPFSISLFVGIIYLISGIGILGLKKWGRVIAVSFSALLGFILILPIVMYIIEVIMKHYSESILGYGILFFIIIPLWPSLIFLIFFTRPKVKEQFK